jgi:hypothetical protein
MKKHLGPVLTVAVVVLTVAGAVVTLGSPASAAKCSQANGGSGSGTTGGTGGVRCPKTGTVIFTDDFNNDPASNCLFGLTNWVLSTNGEVDVFNPGPPASGQVVDLDGSPNQCGGDGTPAMSLRTPITLVAGRTYTAQFVLGNNPSPFNPTQPDVNVVTVYFGPVSGTYTKQATDQGSYTTETLTFSAAANGSAQLTFEEQGPSDRGGVTLDTVTITES